MAVGRDVASEFSSGLYYLAGAAITKAYRLDDLNINLFLHSSRLRFKPTQFLVKALLLASADCLLCVLFSLCAHAPVSIRGGESSRPPFPLIRASVLYEIYQSRATLLYICLNLIIFLKALFLNTLGARTSNICMFRP